MLHRTALGISEIVGDKHHFPPCDLSRILQFERPCRSIARIGKLLFLRPSLVECGKIIFPHKHFASNLNLPSTILLCSHSGPSPQLQRDRTDRSDIGRNIVALNPVTAGRALHKKTVPIEQAYGNTVKLEFCDKFGIFPRLFRQQLQHTSVKLLNLFERVSIGKAPHGLAMRDCRELFCNPSPDPLAGAVGRHQIRKRFFKRYKPFKLLVERIIRYLRLS